MRSNLILPAIGISLVAICSVQAQTLDGVPASNTQALERVVVTSDADLGDSRSSTVSKITIRSDDLQRFNDASVIDALRRVPGITISGQGQAREIRLRGMGNGYTQLLLNGEPTAADFSLDSLAPELIDRIEIQRSATADSSAQAIAGTINIILKRKVSPGQSTLKASVSAYDGLPAGKLSLQYGNRIDQMSYAVVSSLTFDNERAPDFITLRAYDGQGNPLYARTNNATLPRKRVTLGIVPNANWKLGDDDSFSLEGLLQAYRYRFDASDAQNVLFGAGPTFMSDSMRIHDDVMVARVGANWKSQLGMDAKIDVKGSVAYTRKITSITLNGNDATDQEILFRDVNANVKESRSSLTGKYTRSLGDDHNLGVGWDGSIVRRSEESIQRETSNTGFPTQNRDELYLANVSRFALYGQDEWSISKSLSAYAGVRWEGLSTDVSGIGIAGVGSQSSVWSPVLQVLWKIPETKADQMRFALAKTYKSPTAVQLTPRRWVETDNTATTPDYQGNPNLVPELSWGIDIGYEHYLPGDGLVSVNAYSRKINNVILLQVFQKDGLWSSTPTNSGDASVVGLEVEAKGNLKNMWSGAPSIDMRSGFTRNISEIEQLSGPSNRIAGQPPFTATVGADYRPEGTTLTLGANYVFTEQTESQSSQTQWLLSPVKRTLDLYARWQLNKATKIQVTLSNGLHQNTDEQRWYRSETFSQYQSTIDPGFTTLRLSLEMPLK